MACFAPVGSGGSQTPRYLHPVSVRHGGGGMQLIAALGPEGMVCGRMYTSLVCVGIALQDLSFVLVSQFSRIYIPSPLKITLTECSL